MTRQKLPVGKREFWLNTSFTLFGIPLTITVQEPRPNSVFQLNHKIGTPFATDLSGKNPHRAKSSQRPRSGAIGQKGMPKWQV